MLIEKHEEQLVADLLKWWGKYKKIILSLFFTILTWISLSSYTSYNNHQRQLIAAEHYQNYLDAIHRDDFQTSERSLALLQKEYPTSSYASLASMTQVHYELKDSRYESAHSLLNWVEYHTAIPFLKSLAVYKNAEINYLEKNYDHSIFLLGKINHQSELSYLIDHLNAKNYAALNKFEISKEIYEKMLDQQNIDPAFQSLLVAEYNYLILKSKNGI
jgi:predicted negative regulator of RcsB-dependent stress response